MRIIILFLLLLLASACNGPDLPEACGEGTREKNGLYDIDGDGYLSDRDCNESDCTVNPGSKEVCDGVDNDCDDNIDGADDDLKELADGETAEFYINKDCDDACEDDLRTLCVETDVAYYGRYGIVRGVYKNGDGRGGGELEYAFTTCTRSMAFGDDQDNDNNYLVDISDYIYKGNEEDALGPDWEDYFDDCGDESCATDPYCTEPGPATFTDPHDVQTRDYPEDSTLDEECLQENGPGRTCMEYVRDY